MPAIRRNLFAIASALTQIASRSAGRPTRTDDLSERLTALENAHELVPHVLN